MPSNFSVRNPIKRKRGHKMLKTFNDQYNSNIYLSKQSYFANVFLKLASNSCKILSNMNLAKPTKQVHFSRFSDLIRQQSEMMRGLGKVSPLANFNMVLEALKAHFPAPNNFILWRARGSVPQYQACPAQLDLTQLAQPRKCIRTLMGQRYAALVPNMASFFHQVYQYIFY